MSSDSLVPIRLNKNGSMSQCCSEYGKPITLCHICNGQYYVNVPEGPEVFEGAGTREAPWTSIRQIQYEFDVSGKQSGYSAAYIDAYMGCEVHIYASGNVQYAFSVSSSMYNNKVVTYLHADALIILDVDSYFNAINIYGLTVELNVAAPGGYYFAVLRVYNIAELKKITFKSEVKLEEESSSALLMDISGAREGGCAIEDLNVDIDSEDTSYQIISANYVKSIKNMNVSTKLSGRYSYLNCGTIALINDGYADNIRITSTLKAEYSATFRNISIVDTGNMPTAEITNIYTSNSMHGIGNNDFRTSETFGTFSGAVLRNIEAKSIGGVTGVDQGASAVITLRGIAENIHVYNKVSVSGGNPVYMSAGFYPENSRSDLYIKNSTFIIEISDSGYVGHLYQTFRLWGVVENCSFAVNGGTAVNVIGDTGTSSETLVENCSFVYGAIPHGRDNGTWYNVCAYNDMITFNNCTIIGQDCYSCRYDYDNYPDIICVPCESPCQTA